MSRGWGKGRRRRPPRFRRDGVSARRGVLVPLAALCLCRHARAYIPDSCSSATSRPSPHSRSMAGGCVGYALADMPQTSVRVPGSQRSLPCVFLRVSSTLVGRWHLGHLGSRGQRNSRKFYFFLIKVIMWLFGDLPCAYFATIIASLRI